MSILEKIYNAGLKFLVPLTPEEVCPTIVDEAIKLVGVESGGICLKQDGEFKVAYASAPYIYKIKPRKKANTYKAFTTQKTIIADIADVGKAHPEVKKAGIKSSIYIPLSYQSKSIGVLMLDSKNKEEFGEEKMRALVLFGSMASLAIRKAQLYNEIKEALETRDLFISMAAHELRTPLTTVDGYIQLIKDKLRSKKPIQTRWFDDLTLEINRLKLLIDEFLEINRIKMGRLQYDWKESRLAKIVKRAISIFYFSRPNRRVVFNNKLNSIRDVIVGDRNKLIQVITNILENADKYSSEDKDITVRLKGNSEGYILEVIDQGQGISEKELPLILKGFYKGKNSQHEGMGLGLYLSKLIIDHHHGTINISSKLNKGTKVSIILPRAEIVK